MAEEKIVRQHVQYIRGDTICYPETKAEAVKMADGTQLSVIIETKANTSSPAFTGTPTAPTATAGTANTQIATTAFVQNAINSVNPTIQTDGDWAYKVYNDNTFEAWYAIDSEMIDVQTQDTGESVWKSAPQTLTLPSKLTNVYDMVIMFVDVSVGNPNVSTWASLSGTSQSQIEYRVVAAKNISANCFIACHVFGVLFPKS